MNKTNAPNTAPRDGALLRYLTPLGAWALAFGCAVGWGSFVMPGTTFLPVAGPLGAVIGIAAGGVIMLVIAVSYHFLMNRHSGAGGAYTYASAVYGHDHGFLCGWFLILTYVAIVWANATALPLIARKLLPGLFQVGYLYEVAGFQVYAGELALALGALAVALVLCLRSRVAVWVQIVMALVLFGGVIVAFAAVSGYHGSSLLALAPAYADGEDPASGIFTIIALAPWAFVGFESISHSTGEFAFSRKKTFAVLAVAVVTAAIAYGALALMAGAVLPEGCGSWVDYIQNLDNYDGVVGLPTFYAAISAMGDTGRLVMGVTALAGIVTGLVGNLIAASRMVFTLAREDMLPQWFGRINRHGAPGNAVIAIVAVSAVIPLFGRTAIGWIVDVTTVGATITYAYTSASAIREARREGNKPALWAGMFGVVIAAFFLFYFLVPNLLSVTALSTESYFILAAWGILGFAFFLYAFRRDKEHRLGRSTIAWMVLLTLIIFTSAVWMLQTAEKVSASAASAIAGGAGVDVTLQSVERTMSISSIVQILFILAALFFMFRAYGLMLKREKQLQMEKALAEESSRAKTSFLSNMSHEIRTPMNAIIGLDSIALRDPDLSPRTRENLEKIGASAQHLLGLINDILDMSRIESGRMEIKSEEFAFRDFLDQVNVIINGQCADKGLHYDCQIVGGVADYYVGDGMKLRQVLINILGNAVKFTPAGGSVTLTVQETARFDDMRTLRFICADTGIGMDKEFIPKIFDTFSQENEGSSIKYGSTGLGMAITKNIVDMMNGDILVESEKGRGSSFTVTVTLRSSERSASAQHAHKLPAGLRALIVDDEAVACEHARLVAGSIGLAGDVCRSGREALKELDRQMKNGTPYDLVITDYKMPEMDGVDLTRAIRAMDGGRTIVLLLTGYDWQEMQGAAMDAGADGILSKPLFGDVLMDRLLAAMDKRGGAAEAEPETAAPEEGALAGRRVLMAEDMDINAEILADILELEGIETERAENGRIAVDMFNASAPGYYDAILMDMRMPVMDGLEATRTIRALERDDARTIPIIAMTANAFDEDMQRSLQAGMNAHLSKPVEPERLFETLQRLMK